MTKKGLSQTVTVVLFVLIGITAVVIFWSYLQSSFVNLSSQIKEECTTLRLLPSNCIIDESNPADKKLSITLKRSPASEETKLKSAKLIISFKTGESIIKEITNLPDTISQTIPLDPISFSDPDINNKLPDTIKAAAVIDYKGKENVCPVSNAELKCYVERTAIEYPSGQSSIKCDGDTSWVTLLTWFEDDFTSPTLNKFWGDDVRTNWFYKPNEMDKTPYGTPDQGYIEAKEAGVSLIKKVGSNLAIEAKDEGISLINKIKGNFIIEIGYTINNFGSVESSDFSSTGGLIVSQSSFSENPLTYGGYAFFLMLNPDFTNYYKLYPTIGRRDGILYVRNTAFAMPKNEDNLPKRLDLRLKVARDKEGAGYSTNKVLWEYRGKIDDAGAGDPNKWNKLFEETRSGDAIVKELNLNNEMDIRLVQGKGQFIRYIKIQSEEGLPCPK